MGTSFSANYERGQRITETRMDQEVTKIRTIIEEAIRRKERNQVALQQSASQGTAEVVIQSSEKMPETSEVEPRQSISEKMPEINVSRPKWESREEEMEFARHQVAVINNLLDCPIRNEEHYRKLYEQIFIFIKSVTLTYPGARIFTMSEIYTMDYYVQRKIGKTLEESRFMAYSDLVDATYRTFLSCYTEFVRSGFAEVGFDNVHHSLLCQSVVKEGVSLLDHFNNTEPVPSYIC